MEIRAYSSNEAVNFLYKALNTLEAIYVDTLEKGLCEPKTDIYSEDGLLSTLLEFEAEADKYKQTVKDGSSAVEVYSALSSTYRAFYNITRLYADDLNQRVITLRKKCYAIDKSLHVSDDMYSYYKNVPDISDRQFLYKVLANRILVAMKKEGEPYGFNDITPQTKYEMGKYYFLESKDKDGFRTLIKRFVEDNQKRYEGMVLNDPKHKQKENPKEEVER